MFSKRLRAALRKPLFGIAEGIWAAGFAAAGRLARRSRIQPWTTTGGQRVVIVAAHPDDETMGAGGVAMLHQRTGDAVAIVVVTDGGGSGALGLSRGEMVRRRALEIRAAVATLGVSELLCLDLPEWKWTEADARAGLAAPLRDADIVYAPSCVDYHPEHVAVAAVTASLLRAGQVVRIYELGVPLTALLVNRIADIGAVAALKARALQAFETQRGSLEAAQRLTHYRSAFFGVDASEAFWELDAADYARVVAHGDWRRGASPYRGIRARPFTDPLSALIGRRDRLHLRRVAENAAAPANLSV